MASSAIPASTNANIEATTRPLWQRGIVDQVFLSMPMFAKMFDARRFMWRSGYVITKTVKYQNVDGLMQSYSVGQGMNGGRVLNKTKPMFYSKLAQLPVTHDVDEELYNDGGDASVEDLAAARVDDATKGTRIGLYKMMYDADTTDTGTSFQSVIQALNHDATYANTTRSTTVTNSWFQGGSLADTFADQDDEISISINLIRRMTSKMMEHSQDKRGLFFVMGPDLYIKLKSQADAATKYEPGPMNLKYGFDTFTIDGVEIMQDYYLTARNLPNETNPQKWVFGFNVNDWEFAVHPKRQFNLTPFVWQGDRVGGSDSWLARVLLAGNLICWKPNGSIWRSNVTS